MNEAESKGPERRVNERIGVVAPIELRVWDNQGKRSLSETMHAVVTDASRGGLRAELAGPVARLFAENSYAGDCEITISFLVASLHDIGPLPCALRWSRPTPGGHSIGLQLLRDAELMESRVLRELQYGAVAGTNWMSGMRVGVMGGALLMLVGLCALVWDSSQKEEQLRAQLSQVTEGLQRAQLESHNLNRTLTDARAEQQVLREQVASCRQTEASDDDETARPEAHSATAEHAAATERAAAADSDGSAPTDSAE